MNMNDSDIGGVLAGKHIVLGITGGIAAYKSVYLLRLLVRAGAEVQPVATPSALEFITPVTLSALCRKPVVSEFFTANTGEWHSHVSLGMWADAMVIAPATACTLGKMATGVADNMLVTTYLSMRAPVFVAPAMDFDMMAHPTTARNLATLASDGVKIIESAEGELASGLTGRGRMAEPEAIVEALERHFAAEADFAGKTVMITAGPTYERIDPVRFIGNFSTGKMGYALAEAAAARGARVVLVSGPVSLHPVHPAIERIQVESAAQMLEACRAHADEADIAIFAAAVADYAPAEPAHSKIKREHDGIDCIPLVKNPDISATISRSRRPGQYMVGFALETDNAEANAREKLERKGLDMVVVNSLADKGAGFGTDTNRVNIIRASHPDDMLIFTLKNKTDVAQDILDAIHSDCQ